APEPEDEPEPPKPEVTADMLYARFLGEFRKPAAKGDLAKFQAELKELGTKPEFDVARADVNAELEDLASAMAFEQQALKAMAAAGGTVELSEDTAHKFGVKKGKIVGFDQRGLSVDANGPVFSISAKDLPVSDILKNSPDRNAVAQIRYLCARGCQSEAVAMLKSQAPYLKPDEKQRWERKLRLMATGEAELRAEAAYAALAKVAEAKNWRAFMKMLPVFEKAYGNTTVVTEHLGNLAQWKAAAKAAVAPPAEGLEATGKFAPVKWLNVNACSCEVVADPETKNKVLVIRGLTGASLLGEGDKSAVIRTEAPLDLTRKTQLVLRARHKNPKPLAVAIGFMFGVQFFETEPIPVQPRTWSEHAYKIDGAVFKAVASGYVNFDQPLPSRQPNALFILVYTKDPYVLEVDGITVR
ncbi:MAG: hypothetical protein NTW87_13555, partial [Planctomycetota bacterium]|nr:hypothetical protein [Planctomycetota bacterium]